MPGGTFSNQVGTSFSKVENILKGSLDLIPSPSTLVKIQIMSWKGVKAKHYWALSTNI